MLFSFTLFVFLYKLYISGFIDYIYIINTLSLYSYNCDMANLLLPAIVYCNAVFKMIKIHLLNSVILILCVKYEKS